MAVFVDLVKITVQAGSGGNGAVSFHREKFVEHGGPDGGDGGKGGDVIFMASDSLQTLMDFRLHTRYKAEDGQAGMSTRRTGKDGASLVIEVPPGTLVKDVQSGAVLLDLSKVGERKVLLRGGRGGWGNTHFANSVRQSPNFAKPGVKTRAFEVYLELKSIADVGLVGFPNVGKSTLLGAVTAAKPKIANYHFTTLHPNLGIVSQDSDSFVLADIPGLIEGASQGIGLGVDFLRHVERTRLLIHVVDVSGMEGRDPLEDYDTIQQELSQYAHLDARPQIVAASKMDLPESHENLERLRAHVSEDVEIFPVSAATRQGLEALMRRAAAILRELPQMPSFEEEVQLDFEKEDGSFEVLIEDGIYVVEGPSMERLIGSVNFGDRESLNWFHRMLRKMGVIDALREKGAKEGDGVRIEDMEFDFIE